MSLTVEILRALPLYCQLAICVIPGTIVGVFCVVCLWYLGYFTKNWSVVMLVFFGVIILISILIILQAAIDYAPEILSCVLGIPIVFILLGLIYLLTRL